MNRIAKAIALVALGGCNSERQVTQLTSVDALAQLTASYVIDTLPSLAGTSRGSDINDRGWVAGFSIPLGGARHAALWQGTEVVDLGTLGTGAALRSTVQWQGLNNTGMVIGISQTDANEEKGESWSCAPFLGVTGKKCLGFAWENGTMTPLPTLGGPNGYAASANNRGQVVGWAENLVEDSTCNAPQLYQFRAVLWEPKKGTTRELLPFPGEATSAATAINQSGRVVGISGDCDVAVGNFSARRAVLWDNKGSVSEIPNLGGEFWHTPSAINDWGDVTGFSNPTGIVGGAFLPHAFLWTGGTTSLDLGVIGGDDNSQAMGINNLRQVVGVSCLGSSCRGFIWDGVMRDLKAAIAPHFPGVFLSARSITDDGRITGSVLLNTGVTRAFIATPTTP